MIDTDKNPYEPPRRRHILRIIFYVIATAMIVLLVIVLFNVIITRKNGEPPSVFGYSVFIVTTESMEPTLTPGDAILVRKTDPDSLKVDDVITFKEGYDPENRMLVNTHRIVEIVEGPEGRSFRTKGDHNGAVDDRLRAEADILGKAVSAMPKIGSFFAFVKTPFGLVTCIAIPLVILLIFEVINLIRISRRTKEEELLDEEEEAEQGPLATAVSRRRELFEGIRDDTIGEDLRPQVEIQAEEPPLVLEQPASPSTPSPVPFPAAPPAESGAALESAASKGSPPGTPSPILAQDPFGPALQNPVLARSIPQPWQPLRPAESPTRADLYGAAVPLKPPPVSGGMAAPEQGAATPVQPAVSSGLDLHVPMEQENVPLEHPAESIGAVSYQKPVPPGGILPHAPVTQEFPIQGGALTSSERAHLAMATGGTLPVESALLPESEEPGFLASVASQGRDRFKIDGIDVRVKPDAINLALDGDREERDISITVTSEYTNVSVGTKGHEVNFALFRDGKDNGQKVVIQKKARPQPDGNPLTEPEK